MLQDAPCQGSDPSPLEAHDFALRPAPGLRIEIADPMRENRATPNDHQVGPCKMTSRGFLVLISVTENDSELNVIGG